MEMMKVYECGNDKMNLDIGDEVVVETKVL